MMLDEPLCKKSLIRYARCRDPIMQKVVIKIIFCMLESSHLRFVKTKSYRIINLQSLANIF